jgi:hypothetical protein
MKHIALAAVVDGAWPPSYVGTGQKRFLKIEGNKMLFGQAPNCIRADGGDPTRRLTLVRQ